MNRSMVEMKKAVRAGYWKSCCGYTTPAWRRPGKNPCRSTVPSPTRTTRPSCRERVRYASLTMKNPDHAKALYEASEHNAVHRYESLLQPGQPGAKGGSRKMINLVHERTPDAGAVRTSGARTLTRWPWATPPWRPWGEAMRRLNCREKPCVAGCPIHQQIPEFLARVAEGDFDGAYDVITQRSSLPAVCGRVCPQEQSVRKTAPTSGRGEAVAIGRLERFVADWHDAHTPISVPEVGEEGEEGGGGRLRPGRLGLRRRPGRPGGMRSPSLKS